MNRGMSRDMNLVLNCDLSDRKRRTRSIISLLFSFFLFSSSPFLQGCQREMAYEGKLLPFEPIGHLGETGSNSAWIPPKGIVPRGGHSEAEAKLTPLRNGKLAAAFPFPIDRQILLRGQERFQINCSPCHGLLGQGDGMIVQRGFNAPPSFHSDRLRSAPVGHFVDVMTNGFATMYSYADRVELKDRWAIAAYIRVLQESQNARIEDVPEAERNRLMNVPSNKDQEEETHE